MWGRVIARFAGVLLAALLMVLTYLAGQYAGVNAAALSCHEEKLAALERAINQANAIARENAEVAFDHVETIERLKIEYRKIEGATDEHVAKHPALGSCDIGPDGLRIWNDANTSATAARR